VVNVVVGNDSKLSFLGGCVVAPNSGSDKEDSLEGDKSCQWLTYISECFS